jgi:hypothetical protein
MKERREASGKISSHADGLGTVTQQMVEERAKELALIGGRSRVTKEDRLQARKELVGLGGPLVNAESEEENLDSLDPSDVRTESGHHAPNFATDDEEEMVRDLVEHGVDEAEHEQMVEGHLVEEDEDIEEDEEPEKQRPE